MFISSSPMALNAFSMLMILNFIPVGYNFLPPKIQTHKCINTWRTNSTCPKLNFWPTNKNKTPTKQTTTNKPCSIHSLAYFSWLLSFFHTSYIICQEIVLVPPSRYSPSPNTSHYLSTATTLFQATIISFLGYYNCLLFIFLPSSLYSKYSGPLKSSKPYYGTPLLITLPMALVFKQNNDYISFNDYITLHDLPPTHHYLSDLI